MGISIRDAHLYSTAFPCHNCAKHIVGSPVSNKSLIYSRIQKVMYPKFYPDFSPEI